MTVRTTLPDLGRLHRTNLPERLTYIPFGVGVYPEPAHFQLTTALRLLDKALTDWDLTREEFRQHVAIVGATPKQLRGSREPGVTRAFFRAIGHLESLVEALDRTLRLVGALEKDAAMAEFGKWPLPSPDERAAVRDFRNGIAHGDEDLAKGQTGMGVATLRLEEVSISIRDVKLEYAELARMLEQTYDYLHAANTRGLQAAGTSGR